MSCCRIAVVLWMMSLMALPGWGQAPEPPPARYRATVRYDIVAARDIHVALYDAMTKHLAELGFEFTPPLEEQPRTNREDPGVNEVSGLLPPGKIREVLKNRNIETVLLVPETFALPEEPDRELHVRLELGAGLAPKRQYELGLQVRLLLGLIGFREAVGYDHHGYFEKPFTRIVGTVPRDRLDLLVRDLRNQPADWFAPAIRFDDLPSPLRNLNPIRVVEVLPDPIPMRNVPGPAVRSPASLEKIGADLWSLVQQKGEQFGRVRVQLLLVGTPAPDEEGVRFQLRRAAPSLAIDGQLGQVITGSVEVRHLANLAARSEVSTIRSVRSLTAHVDPTTEVPDGNEAALKSMGLTKLHARGFKGKGVRLAILDYDFRGLTELIKDKRLPADTRLIDLTPAADNEVLPLAYPSSPATIGHGCQCALAAHLAAPAAQLVLVRIDPVGQYQMLELIEYARGGVLSEALQRRQDELYAGLQALRSKRERLLEERRKILEVFSDETELEIRFGFLGPVYGWILSDRDWMRQRMAYQQKLEDEQRARMDRFEVLRQEVHGLKGIHVVATALSWPDGYGLGGASPLSRWFNRFPHGQLKGQPLWFQATGNTRGQAWAGPYVDDHGDGVLKFAAPGSPLPKGRWSSDVNFLSWQPWSGKPSELLPGEARVRLSLQWREPHDPDYFLRPGEEDHYLKPLAPLELILLRQRDPEGKLLPADAFEVVARTGPIAQRLEHQPGFSIYEQVLEATLDKPGRYAVRVERALTRSWLLEENPLTGQPLFVLAEDLEAVGIRPAQAPSLPAFEKKWELYTRLFVDVVDSATRPKGRVLLEDYRTDAGTVGTPGDARGVISVGAADSEGKTLPHSATGPLAFAELARRPDILAPGHLQVVPPGQTQAVGTSLATPFAAGWAACLLSSGKTRAEVVSEARRLAGRK